MDPKTASDKRVAKRRILGLSIGVSACVLAALYVILFVRPTLDIPKFLGDLEPSRKETHYDVHSRMTSKGGRMQPVPVTTVTETSVFLPSDTFANVMTAAQAELTSAQGWDLQGRPRTQLAVFFQRSTGSLIRVQELNREVRVVVYQTRYATLIDRLRNWIGMHQKAPTPMPSS